MIFLTFSVEFSVFFLFSRWESHGIRLCGRIQSTSHPMSLINSRFVIFNISRSSKWGGKSESANLLINQNFVNRFPFFCLLLVCMCETHKTCRKSRTSESSGTCENCLPKSPTIRPNVRNISSIFYSFCLVAPPIRWKSSDRSQNQIPKRNLSMMTRARSKLWRQQTN